MHTQRLDVILIKVTLDIFHHKTRLPYLRVAQHADLDHDAAAQAPIQPCRVIWAHRMSWAYLFCSAPFSPFGLSELGPAFAEDVGEDDEADADMCRKRAGRGRKEDEKRWCPRIRKEAGKGVLPLLWQGYRTATENQPVGGGCRGCSGIRGEITVQFRTGRVREKEERNRKKGRVLSRSRSLGACGLEQDGPRRETCCGWTPARQTEQRRVNVSTVDGNACPLGASLATAQRSPLSVVPASPTTPA